MMTDGEEYQQNLESAFGPAARYSEHKPGDIIIYRVGSEVRAGEIIYVMQPVQEGSVHHPLTYVVDSGNGFPDMVWQTDILEDTGEPHLVTCLHCRGMHMSDQVEQCPLKPKEGV